MQDDYPEHICLPELERFERYAAAHTSPEPELLRLIATRTREISQASQMLIGQIEGHLLAILVAMIQPRTVLEIGTYMGYSALAMAEALPREGRVVTCEISRKYATLANDNISASPYADRVDVRIGPALETIVSLPGPFDFVFIDADKGNYRNYYEAVLPKLSTPGFIAVDNVLWSGRVLDEVPESEDTRALVEFNQHVRNDPRVECVMLTVRDGVTLIRKLPG
jgi:caffeoyl-CoA O-methyltransferase